MTSNMEDLLEQAAAKLEEKAPVPPLTATNTKTEPCIDCSVRSLSICGRLDDEALQTLKRIGARRHVARGETISWAGEDRWSCANLLSGMLKVTASTADGREQVVGLLYPSDFVGRPYSTRHEFTVTALTEADMCFFPRVAFEQMLDDHPGLERDLFRRTLSTLDDARAQMLMLARQSATERVADFLLRTADRVGGCAAMPGGPVTFDLPLSRGAMADVLGLTIETVSRQMTRLKTDRIIALPGARTVTLIRRDALRTLAGIV